MENEALYGFSLIQKYGSEFEDYLSKSDNLIILILSRDLTIERFNKGFLKLFDSCRVTGTFIGKDIRTFLIPESHNDSLFESVEQLQCNDSLNNSVQQVSYIKTRLYFSTSGISIMSVLCFVFKHQNSYLIIGDRPILTENHFLDKMSQLNNEITNIARELQKKNREIRLQSREIELKNIELREKNRELEQKNLELEKAHSKINVLSGIIPICMHCKQIRDDEGYWKQVEEYVSEHTEAKFSHGICPKCLEQYYGEYNI